MTLVPPQVPPHLLAYLERHQIPANFLSPGVPMPTVAAAAAAIGVSEEEILKTLLFAGDEGAHVVAIANGTRRINKALLAAASGLTRPRAASPQAVIEVTGYAAGGVSPFALPPGLPVIVDSAVSRLQVAYGGGGAEELLLRVIPADIIRLNHATVAPIVE
jgi:Cys-tRNA(Pro) deacylase